MLGGKSTGFGGLSDIDRAKFIQILPFFLNQRQNQLEREQEMAIAKQQSEGQRFQAALSNPFAYAALQSLGGQVGGQPLLPGSTTSTATPQNVVASAFAPFAGELGMQKGGLGFDPMRGLMGAPGGSNIPGTPTPQGLTGQFTGGVPTQGGLGGLTTGGRTMLEATLGFQGISPETLQRQSQLVTPGARRPGRGAIRPMARVR